MENVSSTAGNVNAQTQVSSQEFSKTSQDTLKMQMEIAQIQQTHALQSSVIEAQVSMTKKGANTIDSGSR